MTPFPGLNLVKVFVLPKYEYSKKPMDPASAKFSINTMQIWQFGSQTGHLFWSKFSMEEWEEVATVQLMGLPLFELSAIGFSIDALNACLYSLVKYSVSNILESFWSAPGTFIQEAGDQLLLRELDKMFKFG